MPNAEQAQLDQDILIWIDELGHDRSNLLLVLQRIQNRYHSISEYAMRSVAEKFETQPAEVFGLVTYYPTLSDQPRGRYVIKICKGLCCDLENKADLISHIESELGITFGETTQNGLFTLEASHCLGMCDQAPVMAVNNQVFTRIDRQTVDQIIHWCEQAQGDRTSTPMPAHPVPAIWNGINETCSFSPLVPGSTVQVIRLHTPAALFADIFENKVIAGAELASLHSSSNESSGKRILVCNTDLSTAGSFKERILLADHYDHFIEGMLISAYIAGTRRGVLYLRPEYENLIPILTAYLERLGQVFDVGTRAVESDSFSFSLDIRPSPGLHAAGKGDVVLDALNSSRSALNNHSSASPCYVQMDVETILKISNFYSHQNSPCPMDDHPIVSNTRLLAISGNCTRPGIYEIPVGTTVRTLLEIVGGADAIAVQVGGISGVCLSPAEFDHAITEEDLTESTNIIVYGQPTNIRKVATKVLEYFALESCGQCAPCREGSLKLLEGLQKIEKGARFSILELNAIAECMQLASKCEFGRMAPRAFQSMLRSFPELS